MSELTCPHCGYEGTKKVRRVVEDGTYFTTEFMPMTESDGKGRSHTTIMPMTVRRMTPLAARLAPPFDPRGMGWGAGMLIGLGLVCLVGTEWFGEGNIVYVPIGLGLIMLVPGIIALFLEPSRRRAFQARMVTYDREYYCDRCEKVFMVP